MTARRVVEITVRLTVEGDAPASAVLNCLGCDMEDAIRLYVESDSGGFGLPDGCDLIDADVLDPAFVA